MPAVVAKPSDDELDKLADEDAEIVDATEVEFKLADVDATEVEFEPADLFVLSGSGIDSKSAFCKFSKALQMAGTDTLSPPPERLGNSSLTPTFWSTASFDKLVSSAGGGRPPGLVLGSTDEGKLVQKMTLR